MKLRSITSILKIQNHDLHIKESKQYFKLTNINILSIKSEDLKSGSDISWINDCVFALEDVKKKLSKFRQDKSTGADDIGLRLLNNIQDDLCVPLYLLFRKSLNDGMVPDDWRSANVSPLYKSGSRTNVENYRPVSLTSQIYNIFESLIRDVLVNHLEFNQAIVDSQHGFRKGRSCLKKLLSFLEQVTSLADNGDSVDVISWTSPRHLTRFRIKDYLQNRMFTEFTVNYSNG